MIISQHLFRFPPVINQCTIQYRHTHTELLVQIVSFYFFNFFACFQFFRFVYNMVTKKRFYEKPTLVTLEQSLISTRDHMIANGVQVFFKENYFTQVATCSSRDRTVNTFSHGKNLNKGRNKHGYL